MLKGFSFFESTIGGSRFLYHSLTAATPHPEHRDIIRTGSDKLHIVPYTHQSPDGTENACYELGEVHHGLISLVHVFHPKRPIKMEELILLMHGIVLTIVNARKAGLYEDSFVLDPKYVYMKRNSTQPQLIYLPMELGMPLKAGFSQLVQYLANAYDNSSPLTGQIIAALKNVVAGDFNLHDMATIVVQAANNQAVDKRFLAPPEKKAPQAKPAPRPAAPAKEREEQKPGFFKRIVNSVTGRADPTDYDDPFSDFDERTMINMTDASKIGLNVAALYVMEENERVLQIPITKDTFVLGRKREEVDFCFDGENKGISRVHASIIYDGKGYYATDKGSSGGTYVNGKRIAPGQPTAIKNDDIIMLYTTKMLFECSEATENP